MSLVLFAGFGRFAGLGCRERPTAPHFLLLRQKKVSKEKATLLSASLRCATGNLRCSVQPGSRANSPAAQTSTCPDPSGPPLLGAYRRDFRKRVRTSIPAPAPVSPVLAGPVNGVKSGIRAARCLSRRRVCADPRFWPQSQVARRAPDCGSPFFCLLFFGEAKKSEALSGAPDTPTQQGDQNQSNKRYEFRSYTGNKTKG